VRGILILLLFAMVTAYVGGATAIYLWLDRRPPNYVTYTDVLLLPVRRDEVRAKRGQAYLDAGIEAMKQQRWSEGEMQLRLGLSRYPQSLPARLALAEFYFLIQQNDRALTVLADGMEAVPGYPGRCYLTNYFTIAGQGQDTGAIIDACNRYLNAAAFSLPEKEARWLLQQKLGALIADGQTEEAMAILADAPDNLVFKEHRVLVMIELGRTEEAARYLADWRAAAGASPQIVRLQVRVERELGRLERMDEFLAELRRLQPAYPAALAYATVQRQMAGADEAAKASLEDFFFRFVGYSANLLLIVQPLAEIGAVSMIQTCLERATELGYDLRPFLLHLAQAQLKHGDWVAAQTTCGRLGAMSTKGRSTRELEAAELTTILADIAAQPADGPQVALLKFL
jgi:Tfp pilus assembly protein PilF